MKRYSGVFIVFVALIGAIWMTYDHYSDRSREAERELDRTRLSKDYLERVNWVRANPDEKGYRYDANALFRWHFRNVDEHLAKFGGSKAFDEFAAELDKRTKENDPKLADKQARYQMVKTIFEQMRAGQYQPLWTGTQNGIRLDILSASTTQVGDATRIRWQVALWGAHREVIEEGKNLKKVVASANFDVKVKLLDTDEKSHFEMNVTGDPSLKTDYPERYIWAFPPQMMLGHFDIPLVPAEAEKAEISFLVDSRAPFGGAAQAYYVWKLDIPSAWKLKPGEKWEGAQEEIRAEESPIAAKPSVR